MGQIGFRVYMGITAIIAVVALLLGSGIGYAIGKNSTQSTRNDVSEQGFGGNGPQSSMGGMRRMGDMGTVTTVSDTSITIKSMEGSAKTYKITSDTAITNEDSKASISDIKAGDTVMVRTSESDSDTATSIRIGDMMPQRFGGNGQSSAEN